MAMTKPTRDERKRDFPYDVLELAYITTRGGPRYKHHGRRAKGDDGD